MIYPPAIRRVPPDDTDPGRYIATFIVDDDSKSSLRFIVHLPWREGNPTLAELEAEAREKLKERLTEIIADI